MALERLPRDFVELLAEFNRGRVEYLLIGGYAVACHGHPRFTSDMDLWVHGDARNSRRAAAALARFGFPEFANDPDFFARPKSLARLGNPPLQIDLLTDPLGLDFKTAWRNRAKMRVERTRINVLSLADLIRVKRATGRPQDLADAERLEMLRSAAPEARRTGTRRQE